MNGKIVISFPNVKVGQAIISAIAIATKDKKVKPANASPLNIQNVTLDADLEVRVASWMDVNSQQFLDKKTAVIFTQIPSEIAGAEYLQFSDRKITGGSFTLLKDSNVYVLFPDFEKVPAWLDGYTKMEEKAKNDLGFTFDVYQKKIAKTEKVSFGAAGSHFVIAAVPTYDMGEKDDSRQTLVLEAENGKTTGAGIVKGNFKKSDYVEFTQKTKNSIQFEVKPGVAGIYLMRFKFMNRNNEPVKVKFKMQDAYGIMMRDDSIEFFSAPEKWKILNTTSGGYINAGTYTITLEGDDLRGLMLDNFEFQ